MGVFKDRLKNKLNGLLEKNYDAEAGFKKVAEELEEGTFKDYFLEKSLQRREFGNELKKELISYDMDFETGTSFVGDIHRAFINVKSLLGMSDPEAMVTEVVRGEEQALMEYDSVLDEVGLLGPTRDLLTEQRSKIALSLSTAEMLEALS